MSFKLTQKKIRNILNFLDFVIFQNAEDNAARFLCLCVLLMGGILGYMLFRLVYQANTCFSIILGVFGVRLFLFAAYYGPEVFTAIRAKFIYLCKPTVARVTTWYKSLPEE